jgi:fermentation-respiration switch protein FrsA (DUF1100 family)
MTRFETHGRKLLAPFLILLLLLLSGCSSFYFYPRKELVDNPIHRLFAPEDVFFAASDGTKLHGWLIRAQGKERGTLLVLHGNAENLSTHVNSVLWLARSGFNVFIIDYRGYGRSEGVPSLAGVHRDAIAAIDTLFTLPGVDHERVAVLGQSIGGAIALTAVAHSPQKSRIRAIAVDSTFPSYRRIVRDKLSAIFFTWPFQYPISWFFADDFSPERHIAELPPVPILVIHGDQDRVIPLKHGQRLYASLAEPKEFWLVHADHIASFADPEIRRRFVSFLEQAFAVPPQRQPGGVERDESKSAPLQLPASPVID